MIVHEITRTESHPTYAALQAQNLARQYDFLRSMLLASVELGFAAITHEFIHALNSQAVGGLHRYAGAYRPKGVEVYITETDHKPAQSSELLGLMNGFVDTINREWTATDPFTLSAYSLWRLNSIHPFENGNGRTARAICYYVLCRKIGVWLPGERTIPDLIKDYHEEYVAALRIADAAFKENRIDVKALAEFLIKLFELQIKNEAINLIDQSPEREGT
jgi:hypothetical protein